MRHVALTVNFTQNMNDLRYSRCTMYFLLHAYHGMFNTWILTRSRATSARNITKIHGIDSLPAA